MTEKNEDESDESNEDQDDSETVETEQKAMLKSMSENLKTLVGKYEAVEKDNVALKETVSVMAKELAKITEALNKPVHKSEGVQINDAETKAKVQGKSVDPLDCF